ncbi:resistance to inhibitors of cholinesterase protein 3 [Amia ocellicauda]|uniref:resistance to inhibitors of cholinesterase protein 3 n=1 Tax=Amia ocellicauda TaxID=2972642 RepID=UPI0034646E73
MLLSSSQQLMVLFSAVLFAVVLFPRMFGGGSKDPKPFDPHFNRKVRGPQVNMNAGGAKSQPFENMQQMRKMMEQEIKSERLKGNNKGYVFTLMPLYAIGVGVFAAYKFLKIKSKDESKNDKDKCSKGAKKSDETAENQLNELEQRLAQTEKMLNSILTQLDPLTTCVESVAFEQKNEIMAQLHSIRQLMKKRGMDCPPMNAEETACDKKLEDLIESLTAKESEAEDSSAEKQDGTARGGNVQEHLNPDTILGEIVESEVDENNDGNLHTLTLKISSETRIEDVGALRSMCEEIEETGLRRRNRPE